MKNSIKLIAAAALVATSGFASAAIDDGSTGNSELFFRAYDSVSQNAYFFDTGLTFASFTPAAATNQTYSLTNFASFLSTVNTASTTWGVYATDNVTPVGFYTTAVGTVTSNVVGQSKISNVRGKITVDARLANSNAADPAAANTYSLVSGIASGSSNDALAADLKFSNNLPFVAAGSLDTTSLNFYLIDSGTALSSKRTQFANAAGASTWNLNTTTGTLSFVTATAPVPEPSTYALAIAGLAVVGALSRRKKAAK